MKEEKKFNEEEVVSPLRNEVIEVKFVPRPGKIMDPKHVLYGGMAEGAVRTYTVPKLNNGLYKNPLTDSEKTFLENYMGLEPNALSVYKDYWDNYFVRVPKYGLRLNLSDPKDYIAYKVLLLNNNRIAPNVKMLSENQRASYEFVLSSDHATIEMAKTKMQYKKDCYKWLGKNEDDYDTMKIVVEQLDGRKISPNTSLGFLQTQVGELIENDAEKFIKFVNNPMLETQILISKAIDKGIISKQGNFYYLKNANGKTPLCNEGEDPDLRTTCKYLNDPKNQEIKFSIEAKLQ